MRVLAVLMVALAVTGAVSTAAADRAQAASAACAGRSVAANATQWKAAQAAFADAFARIRTYLLTPTIANQSKMYARVDTNLFEFYSYSGGNLNSNRGKVSGSFSWTFVPGSQCYTRATKTTSFEVHLRANFKSTNHRTLKVADLAKVEMKTPKITLYFKLPGK
jgi:hypothetical protein